MMSNSNKPSAFKAKPMQQQTPAEYQISERAAARRPVEGTAAQRQAQQRAAAQRQVQQQAAAQRQTQQQVAAQRRPQQQVTAQHQVQQAAAQQRAQQQATATRASVTQKPVTQNRTRTQQPNATAQRRAPAQAAAQRPAQQPVTTQRRAPAQAAAQRPMQQSAATQRRAPAQATAQRPAQQPVTTQRRAPAPAAAQRPMQQSAATQRRAPAQAAAQRPAQQAATAQTPTARHVTKAQATQGGVVTQKATDTYAQRQAQVAAKKRAQQEQKLTRQEKKATKLTAKGKKRTVAATQTKPQKRTQASAASQTNRAITKSPVKKQRGPKQPLPPTLKGKIQYGFQQIGPTIAEIQADPYKKSIATRVIIIVLALLLSIRLTSVINDILGFGRSTDSVTFTISEDNMTTNKIIGQLDRKGFIKHSVECKVFIALTDSMRSEDYTKATYLKGDYVLSKNMGIEKMLLQCMNIQRQETVEVSVPEGYNVVQIGETLEKNKVCSQEDFLKACSKTDYDFDFLQNIDNADSRYAALEGYLYPDTYEFYVGQDAESVVKKMLSNFQSKWTDEYEARAEEINMTMDQVLTMASIVQKEDSKASNMAYISSVFYNRLNSSSFPTLQSDATVNYVKEYIKPHVTETEYNTYLDLYSTYNCKGLPVGAICNPGNDAIKAVLWPQTTSYYFFAHDDDGNIYLARTANEQNANVNKAAKSSSSDDS
jgi:UPF0755 protein